MSSSLFALVVVLTVGGFARADTSSSAETTNAKSYGNCQVITKIDMFTDATRHVILCAEKTLTDQTAIVLSHQAGRFDTIGISKGLQFHVNARIPVAIRIDKGQLIQRNAHWSSPEFAFIQEEQLAHSLLNDLAHGKRVAIQVGKERGHVLLDGSRKAVADFRQRIGLHAQQTLTIEQRKNLPANKR